jgi:hypothetical protein
MRTLLALVFVAIGLSLEGCSSGNAAPSQPNTTGDQTPLSPPANVDGLVCITAGEDLCATCCEDSQMAYHEFAEGRCYCGVDAAISRSICAGHSATDASCANCCIESSFHTYEWSSYEATRLPSTCVCQQQYDYAVCATTANADFPPTACEHCCLNSGFFQGNFNLTGKLDCRCDQY